MKKWVVAYVLIGVLSGQIAAGWAFAHFSRSGDTRATCYKTLGAAQAFGMLTVAAWPILLLETYLLSGLAYHGWLSPMHCRPIAEREP